MRMHDIMTAYFDKTTRSKLLEWNGSGYENVHVKIETKDILIQHIALKFFSEINEVSFSGAVQQSMKAPHENNQTCDL